MRPSGRTPEQPRDIRITRNFTRHAEGSVLVEFGDTKVICTASVENKVPPPSCAAKAVAGSPPNTACYPAPPAAAWAVKPPAANRAAAP